MRKTSPAETARCSHLVCSAFQFANSCLLANTRRRWYIVWRKKVLELSTPYAHSHSCRTLSPVAYLIALNTFWQSPTSHRFHTSLSSIASWTALHRAKSHSCTRSSRLFKLSGRQTNPAHQHNRESLTSSQWNLELPLQALGAFSHPCWKIISTTRQINWIDGDGDTFQKRPIIVHIPKKMRNMQTVCTGTSPDDTA